MKAAIMPRLILFRHAKSDWSRDTVSDFDRTLSERGHRDAPVMGEHLSPFIQDGMNVFCSAAMRTRQTYEHAHISWPDHKVEFSPELYEVSVQKLYHFVRSQPDNQNLMLIGHNPGLFMLLVMLAGYPELKDGGNPFPTAAVAVLDTESPFSHHSEHNQLTLTHYIRPRDLKQGK